MTAKLGGTCEAQLFSPLSCPVMQQNLSPIPKLLYNYAERSLTYVLLLD